MAYKATLTIEDKTYQLLECGSRIEQQVDNRGRPKSEVRGGSIIFIVSAVADDDLLPTWATDKKKKHDGKITMYQWDQDTKFKEISFKNAFVTFFSESFMIDPGNEFLADWLTFVDTTRQYMYTTVRKAHEQFRSGYLYMLSISAEQMTIDGIEHNNRW